MFLNVNFQENHEYLVRIFARNEVGLSDPLESDEPFLVKKPTGNVLILFTFEKCNCTN